MKMLCLILLLAWSAGAQAIEKINLMQFFQKACLNDPTYQQIVEKTLASEQNIGISRSDLLPHIELNAYPARDKLRSSGTIVTSGLYPPLNYLTSLDARLTLKQTLIDFTKLSNFERAKLSVRKAHADLNEAYQELILRVAKAYLTVLFDEENIANYKSSKAALHEQLYQVQQRYQKGDSTIADLYKAKSAYSNAETQYIEAQAVLADDKDFLGTMAGEDIQKVALLREHFPIVKPTPTDREAWVNQAKQQNWSVKANELAVLMAKEFIRANSTGHLPSVGLELRQENYLTNSKSTGASVLYPPGSSRISDSSAALYVHVPIFAGGLIVSKTRKAEHQYLQARRQLDASLRNTIHTARQSHLRMMVTIKKLQSNKLTIYANTNSLKSTNILFRAGSTTMAEVLNQQEKILQAKTEYARNRQAYIMNLLKLKKAAGILCIEDLVIINSWLK